VSTIRSESAQQTEAIGAAVAALAKGGDVVALDGELGAGKTQFVRGMASALGLDPGRVSSPTFVLMHEYEGGRVPFVHLDAYRLHAPGELEELGFDDIRRGAVTAVEWASRAGDALGDDQLAVFIEHGGGNRRVITFTPHGSWRERAGQLHASPCPICKTPALAAMTAYPFCSERCQRVDLGRWLGEDYRISRPIEQRDLEEGV